MWLSQEEMDEMCEPYANVATTVDANWNKLRKERDRTTSPPIVKRTRTPALLILDKTNAFMWEQYNAGEWKKRLFNADPKNKAMLNATQYKLRDSLSTLMNATNRHNKVRWISPLDTKNNVYDNSYAIVRIDHLWYISIGDKIFKESTRRIHPKGYTRITFSSTQPPAFTQAGMDQLLDTLIGHKL